eukprot:88011_1
MKIAVTILCMLIAPALSTLPQPQLASLIDFYEFTNGDYWIYPLPLCFRKYQWNITEWKLNGFDCSKNWCGLTTTHPLRNPLCQITGLGIQGFNASGFIPHSIGNLTVLSTISIRNNPYLSGIIPNTISKLSYLQGITFTYNGWLTISNPKLLCNLSKLYQLTFSQIIFIENSTLDDFNCIFNNNNYRFFSLRDIKGLSGVINDHLCNVTQDIMLYNIYDMTDTSYIPQCLLLKDPTRNHKTLQFSNIKLSGTIPNSFCNITYLNGLSLTNVSLTGTVPSCIFNMSSLVTLSLYHTQLSGTIHSITLPSVVA